MLSKSSSLSFPHHDFNVPRICFHWPAKMSSFIALSSIHLILVYSARSISRFCSPLNCRCFSLLLFAQPLLNVRCWSLSSYCSIRGLPPVEFPYEHGCRLPAPLIL